MLESIDLGIPTIQPSVENLLQEIGGFSWFQLWAMFIIISPQIICSMIDISPVLTGSSDVPFYCDSPQDNFTVFANNISVTQSIAELCRNGTLRPHGLTTSVVQEWGLIGKDAWVSDLFTSVQMLGGMVGALVASHFADRYGRKKTHYGFCFLMGAFGFASGWAQDPYSYAFARFCTGIAVGGCCVIYMSYLMEFLPSYRMVCGCVSLWAVGVMLLGFVGYQLPQWRHTTWATSLPSFLILLTYPWFPESPRWLLCQERTSEAIEVFDTIAKWNGKPCLDPAAVKAVQKTIIGEKDDDSSSCMFESLESLKILKIKEYRTQLLILMLAWFSCELVYFGLSFDTKNLIGDPYWNIFYMGLTEIPCSFTGIFFSRIGRKKTFIGFGVASSLCLMGLIVVDMTSISAEYPDLINILSLSARYFLFSGFVLLECFTAESFPTVGRVSCMGLCAIVGNIGGILAPQFTFLGTILKSSQFISFGLLTWITVLASFKLKDSTGDPLEDSIHEK